MAIDTQAPRSRRTILAAAFGGLAGWVASSLGRPAGTLAAAGDPLIIGSTANNAGTANTTLTTASTGTALLVTQAGGGTALRGSAVGTGSIAGFFTAQSGVGVSGVTGNGTAYGVFAQNNGAASTGGAIRASGANNHGVVATTANNARCGVVASNSGTAGSGAAVKATGGHNFGLDASSIDNAAVRGVLNPSGGLDDADGFLGVLSPGGPVGAAGNSQGGVGVSGNSDTGIGVYGSSGTGHALYGDGDGAVTGAFSKASGTFKIDHPGDPAGKYLQHSFVESPDMKNVYDGVVSLDANGEARVALPSYFETLNRELRYQLTAVGSPAPDLHVKTRVAKGRFTIAGGKPGQEVCWQVTGVRTDPWAEAHRVVVELPKPGRERGTYLHPELYGQPPERGLNWPLRAGTRRLFRGP